MLSFQTAVTNTLNTKSSECCTTLSCITLFYKVRRAEIQTFYLENIKEGLNNRDVLISYKFYKSCLYDKLITLSLTAAHSEGNKGAGL